MERVFEFSDVVCKLVFCVHYRLDDVLEDGL